MKNVIRKLTTWLLVFGMSFTPVLTSIDVVAANADEQPVEITVDNGKTYSIKTDNLEDSTKQTLNEAKTANDAANNAAELAANAGQNSADALKAAADAKTAADNAEAIADAAQAFLDAFSDSTDADGNKIDGINTLMATAETAVQTAQGSNAADTYDTLLSEAENSLTSATGVVDQTIGAVNTQVTTTTNAINTANTAKSATDGLIDAAAQTLRDITTAEGNAQSKYETEIVPLVTNVNKQVNDAVALYTEADDDAKKEINTIADTLTKSLIDADLAGATEKAANAAGAAMDGATDQDTAAIKAYNDTYKSYTNVVNEANEDVPNINYIRQNVIAAQSAADRADQAATSAEAFAKIAIAAEGTAKLNYEAALAAYNKALADYQAAQKKYAEDYKAADDASGLADSAVKTANEGKIKEYNEEIDGINSDINTYNTTTIVNVNGKIDDTNDKIVTANTEIGNLTNAESTAASALRAETAALKVVNGLIVEKNKAMDQANTDRTDAENKLKAAKDALDAAKLAYDTASTAYKDAEDKVLTAQDLADKAATEAQNANDFADKALDAEAIANAAVTTSKDALAKIVLRDKNTNYTTYEGIVGARDTADSAYKAADQALTKLQTETYNEQFYTTQNGIVDAEEAKIDALEGTKSTKEGELKTLKDQTKEANRAKYSTAGIEWVLKKLGVSGGLWTYEQVLDCPGWARKLLFSDSAVEGARADKTTVENNKTPIDNLEKAIKGLETDINDLKKEGSALYNAQEELKKAEREVGAATKLKNDRYATLTEKQADVDSIDNFDFTGNTLVIDLSALDQHYASFADVDADTTTYKEVRKGWVPDELIPDWLARLLPGSGLDKENQRAQQEKAIEEKYGFDSIQTQDNKNVNTLVTYTNDRLVITCTDIDQLAVMRATYAQHLIEQAAVDSAALNQAKAQADADKKRAEDAAKNAKDNAEKAKAAYDAALKKYNDAKAEFDKLKEYKDSDKLAAKVAPEHPEQKSLSKDLELAKEYPVEGANSAYLAEYKYQGPARQDNLVDTTERRGKGTVFEITEFTGNYDEAIKQAWAEVEKALEAYNKAKEDSQTAQAAAIDARNKANEAKRLAAYAAAILNELTRERSGSGSEPSSSDATLTTAEEAGPVLIPLGPTTGVAGVRTGRGRGTGTADGTGNGTGKAPAENLKAANDVTTIEEAEELPGAAEATTLEDEDLAGAQGVEEEASMWWIWLLGILAALAGFGVYKYVDNKKKNANTINK